MADNMREILGDLLYTDPPDDEKTQMPSPELLKGKILVKAKRLPPGKGPEDELEEEDETDGVDDLDEKKKVNLTTCFPIRYIRTICTEIVKSSRHVEIDT